MCVFLLLVLLSALHRAAPIGSSNETPEQGKKKKKIHRDKEITKLIKAQI